MITGDHPVTATAVARAVGIAHDPCVVTGAQLAAQRQEAWRDLLTTASVYARVAPAQKLQIVQALCAQGEVVAMTGDGVNDAPALRQADIGVAMGITGTTVAQEAADVVLRDDNFATIVAAVEEGRVIYANIRKVIRYLLTCNVGELAVMLLAPLCGLPVALLPLQILWMNLVTDGLPALALVVEPAEPDVMRRPPRPATQPLLDRPLLRFVLLWGTLLALLTLASGGWAWQVGTAQWRTQLFTTLVFGQLALALAVRGERTSLLRLGMRTNPALLGALLLTIVLQLAVIYLPPLQRIFDTVALSAGELGSSIGASVVMLVSVEGVKAWRRRR